MNRFSLLVLLVMFTVNFAASQGLDKSTVSGEWMLNNYGFQSFRETKDSLYFIGVQEDFGKNLKGRNTAGFQKGNIKLITDSKGKLLRLEVKELFQGNASKHKVGTADVIERTENSPVVCLRTYFFKPLKDTYSCEFSDYGIFKPVLKGTVSNKAHE